MTRPQGRRTPPMGCGEQDGHHPWVFTKLSTGNDGPWAHGNLASCGRDLGRDGPDARKLPRTLNSLDYNRAAVTPSALTRLWQ